MSNTTTLIAEINYLNQLGADFNRYFLISSAAFGIPSNLVAMFIFSRLAHKKTNMGFLYTWQASIDLSVLLITFFVARSSSVFLSFSLANLNDSMCKFVIFARRYILHASSWMPVLITFDRFTFVLYGHSRRFKFLKNKFLLVIIILIMLTLLAILDIPNLMFYLPANTSNPSCMADRNIVLSSDMISIVLRTYLPFLIMIVLNALMVRKIRESSRRTFKQTAVGRREYHFTLATMAYDAYFLLFNFPLSVFYIFFDINLYSGAFMNDRLLAAKYSLANSAFINFSFCEQTLTIFMYVAFNKLFRNELIRVCTKYFLFALPSLQKRVSPTSQTASRTGAARETRAQT